MTENILRIAELATVISIFVSMALAAVSMEMIRQYLWRRKLAKKWQLITGLMSPCDAFSLYISETRKEQGSVGLWFKLLILSFVAMFFFALLLFFLGRIGQ